MTTNSPANTDYDVLIVGAGWAGMMALHRMRQLGLRAHIIEAAGDVGGTWYWNRYPGARCDVESIHYSYSFSEELQQEWTWTERYAAQPELLAYARHVADRFGLRQDITFNIRVDSAVFNEQDNTWAVRTDDGATLTARFCIMATGVLSAPKNLDIPGLESFGGEVYNTYDWPEGGVDFTGKRVAVIGTGSSGIQTIPEVAKDAEHLYVFQRTPSYSLPAHNRPLTSDEVEAAKRDYPKLRARARGSFDGLLSETTGLSALEVDPQERERIYHGAYQAGLPFQFMSMFTDIPLDQEANATAARFVAERIRERVGHAPIADALIPTSYPFATRRLCIDTDYYETFTRDNVTLVDLLQDPITAITATGVATSTGTYEVDCLVLATGFDAITGALSRMDIRGRNGLALKDKWADGARSYLGVAMAGFPNLFTVTGPQSPSVLSNMMVSIEQHVDWITDCLRHLVEHNSDCIEATAEAEEQWVTHAREISEHTLFPLSNSWYLGANVPGKPHVVLPYLGGVGAYRQVATDIAQDGYRGFTLGAPSTAPATAAVATA
ncbi:flavin-containing monooxygenase [Kocuria arenosa]|uniref:flavin-containing monooxygenase n=1 Tax=Kocuria arenosa TaxID=3071446 RepID=UPI0034D44BF8